MTALQTHQKGVTPPISLALPTTTELTQNDNLIAELKKQNNFEASDETERRKKTLQTIQKVTVEFVKVAMSKKNKPQSSINAAGGKIFTYGSYRLGVYGPGSDIDTLVVVPKDVTREDFFEHFPPTLERLSPPGAIEELTPVPDAFVPIIKLEFSGISIDLIFARLAISSVPLNLDLKDNNLLRGLDERDLRSLNGTRVTDEILELVPQQKIFRTALRAVKLWAQRRAVYANVMGFPGGVAWAMLVARTCQLYPQATGSVIVGKFFRIIARWTWPQPVMLKEIENGPLQVRVWNPAIYHGDRFHLMPIITPAYPSMCATHNITMSTKKIILRELERGGDIVDRIFTGQMKWKDLFDRHTFFVDGYKYYLSIISTSTTKEAQQIWSGLVESKVRHLVTELENDSAIEIAHPFNKGFERVHRCSNQDEIDAVASGELNYQVNEVKTETTDAVKDPKHNAAAHGEADNIPVPNATNGDHTNGNGTQLVYTTTYYIGIEMSQTGSKKLDISFAANRFRETCFGWANYKKDLNFLVVASTRNFDLPADVFQPGEVKPIRQKKKPMSKKDESIKKDDSASKKRKHETDEAEATVDSQNGAKRRQSENGVRIPTS